MSDETRIYKITAYESCLVQCSPMIMLATWQPVANPFRPKCEREPVVNVSDLGTGAPLDW
jgi:hypothetical protein